MLLLFVLLASLIVLQTPLQAHSQYYFKDLLPGNKLLDRYVFITFEQSDGMLWIGTSSGLTLYDGHNQTHYMFDPDAKTHISNNVVLDIVEDANRAIWVATEGGLNRINKDGTIDYYFTAQGLPSDWVMDLYIDSQQNLWAATDDGLTVFNQESNSFDLIESGHGALQNMIEDESGKLWLPFRKRMVSIDVNTGERQQFDYKDIGLTVNDSSVSVSSSARWRGKLLFAVNGHGLLSYDYRNEEFNLVNNLQQIDNYIYSIAIDNNDHLFIATQGSGIYLLNLIDSKFDNLIYDKNNKFSLPDNSISHIRLDKDGNLWASTDNGIGVASTVDKLNTEIFFQGNTLDNSLFYKEMYNFGSGVLIQKEQDVVLFDKQTLSWQPDVISNVSRFFPNKLNDIAVNDKTIYLASNNGIYVIEKSKSIFLQFSDSPPIAQVDDMVELNLASSDYKISYDEKRNGLWLAGSTGNGIIFVSLSDYHIKYFTDGGIKKYSAESNYTLDMKISESGDLFVGSSDGVFRINPDTGATYHYHIGGSSEYVRVFELQEVDTNVFWLATQGKGALQVKFEKDSYRIIKRYDTSNILPDNNLYSMIVDERTLYFSTYSQLFEVNLEKEVIGTFDNLAFIDDMIYSEGDLLKVDSKLYITSNYGLTVTSIDDFSKPKVTSPIISSVRFDDNQYYNINQDSNELIEVEASYLRIEFTARNYFSASDQKYKFKLSSEDDYTVTSANYVEYHKLPSGDYTLEVYSLVNGIASKQPAIFSFSVPLPKIYYLYLLLIIAFLLIVFQAIYLKNRKIRDLQHLSETDTLTKIYNRLGFNKQLKSQLESDKEFALVIIDVDKFKDVNDQHGHPSGDSYLKQIASRLNELTRGRDIVARLSGDEFALLLNDYGDRHNLSSMLLRIHDKLQSTYILDNTNIEGSFSVGVAIYKVDAHDEESLFSHADSALYDAKDNGRGQIVFFNKQLEQDLQVKTYVKWNLATAVDNDELVLFYQPKISCRDFSLIGVEALIRWQPDKDTIIRPDQFIPDAEASGDIIAIGNWVIQQACRDAQWLDRLGLLPQNVSVNVSAKQLLDRSIVDVVARALEESGLQPSKLELELTESTVFEGDNQAVEIIEELKRLGVHFALDDFGSGFSSLAYLSKLEFDTLKIDKSLVDGISTNQSSLRLLQSIALIADDFNLAVVIEGVETHDQEKLITQHFKFDLQGYRYSKPISIEQLIEKYTDV
jgi:diguanylate cyclase (GGDEF)-like protein